MSKFAVYEYATDDAFYELGYKFTLDNVNINMENV